MSLDKAILHGKEHRKAYSKYNGTFAKAVDCTCRNHGSCPWCRGNRIYKNVKKEHAMMEAVKKCCDLKNDF